MKTTMKNASRILAALLLSFVTVTILESQTISNFYTTPDESVVFKYEHELGTKEPKQVILVYDSNLIALETTSLKKITRVNTSQDEITTLSAIGAFAASEYVDIEMEMPVEDWMTHSFDCKGKNTVDLEEEVVLEDWMANSQSWLLSD